MRLRSAKNVSAFIVRSVPVPRDIPAIRKLGRLALPLYLGAAFAAFRGGVPEMPDPEERIRRIALLDAMTARLYGLGPEEYGLVLDSFPLLDEMVKSLYRGTFLASSGNRKAPTKSTCLCWTSKSRSVGYSLSSAEVGSWSLQERTGGVSLILRFSGEIAAA